MPVILCSRWSALSVLKLDSVYQKRSTRCFAPDTFPNAEDRAFGQITNDRRTKRETAVLHARCRSNGKLLLDSRFFRVCSFVSNGDTTSLSIRVKTAFSLLKSLTPQIIFLARLWSSFSTHHKHDRPDLCVRRMPQHRHASLLSLHDNLLLQQNLPKGVLEGTQAYL
jgi:hypothetical protein